MKKILIATLIIAPFLSRSQYDVESLLNGSVADAEKILEAYSEPIYLGFGFGMNSGWYNTAKTHKLLGFDITPTITFARIPTDAQFYDLNGLGLTELIPVPNENGSFQSPTALGPNLKPEDLPSIAYEDANGNEVRVSTPTGIGMEEYLDQDLNSPIVINAMPSAMAQVGIGLVKNTDVVLRIIPKIEEPGDYEFSMFGLGVKHDLKQWIPGLSLTPFDFAGFAGWNKINSKVFIDENEPDQAVEVSTSGFTVQGIVSKKFWIFTPYLGLGFATSSSNVNLLGTYEIDNNNSLTDPLSFDASASGFRGNLGLQMKILILTIHADYAIQKYNTITLGLGLSIR